MGLRFYYSDPDAGTVEFTDHVKQGIGQVSIQTKAEQGTVATSSITIEDPEGELNFSGLRTVWIEEDTATFKRIATGWAWVRTFERGDYYRTSDARQITMQFQDLNHRIWRKVMAGHDTDRPAESDYQRVQWLFSTGEAADMTDVTTYVFSDGPVAMDANPDTGYNGQMFQQVLDDCAQQSGKNYFALDHYNGSDYVDAYWYGPDSVDDFVSSIKISNDLADIDVDETWAGTVFPPNEAAKLDRDPSRVYSGVFGNFDGGFTYQSRSATIAQFANRDTTASWPNVKTLVKAQARANRYLETLAEEEDAITASILVCLAQVNDVRAGQRIDVKFTHMPGYEDYVTCRVVTKTVTDVAWNLYEIELELLPLGPAPEPASCSTVVSGMQSWDSGEIHHIGGAGTGTAQKPIIIDTGPTPATYPAVVVSVFGGQCGFSAIGSAFALSGPTQLFTSRPTGTGFSTVMLVGYEALASGDPADLSITWAGTNPIQYYEALSIVIPTSATAPVHTGVQRGSGATATLDGAATPGNLLVLCKYAETIGFAVPDPPTGFTRVAYATFNSGTIGFQSLEICVRCAEEGDGAEFNVGDSTKAHWASLSEWVL